MAKHLFLEQVSEQLAEMKNASLFKDETILDSPQDINVITSENKRMINFCANNYLGLSNHPALITAAKKALDDYGLGMSSVRFICGTQTPHKALEQAMADFSGTEDCILYSSCFDANGGLFETLLTAQDAIISDTLNHASIIDGIRLCKAKRYRFKHQDIEDLSQQCAQARADGARHILIATDGVFSMDGVIADLATMHRIAEKHGALLMVDDCHATGFVGSQGRGTAEYCNVFGKIDIITGTFGKALGGASGGYVCASKPIVEMLRQRSRPYLFSNAMAPSITAASLAAVRYVQAHPECIQQLQHNTNVMRDGLKNIGYRLIPGTHPIIPIMLGDAVLAKKLSQALLSRGILAIDFSYPVVPKNQARIRLQMSAAHTEAQMAASLSVFSELATTFNIHPDNIEV